MMTEQQELETFKKWWLDYGGDHSLLDDDVLANVYMAAEAAWMYRANYTIEYTAEDL
jgi:hypothetical protein